MDLPILKIEWKEKQLNAQKIMWIKCLSIFFSTLNNEQRCFNHVGWIKRELFVLAQYLIKNDTQIVTSYCAIGS